MDQHRNAAEKMQRQIVFGKLGERVDLDRPVFDALQQQNQTGDPGVDAVSVAMEIHRVRHLRPS